MEFERHPRRSAQRRGLDHDQRRTRMKRVPGPDLRRSSSRRSNVPGRPQHGAIVLAVRAIARLHPAATSRRTKATTTAAARIGLRWRSCTTPYARAPSRWRPGSMAMRSEAATLLCTICDPTICSEKAISARSAEMARSIPARHRVPGARGGREEAREM